MARGFRTPGTEPATHGVTPQAGGSDISYETPSPDPRCLSIEPRRSGFAVYAPDFYVWDREGDRALAWAAELWTARSDPPDAGGN